jgi:hypothetical protein
MRLYVGTTALACAALLALASSAQAYCRARTCKNTSSYRCETEGICIVEGKELYRASSCTSYAVEQTGSTDHSIGAAEFDGLIEDAFERWLSADCGGGETPSLDVVSLGAVACDDKGYNTDSGNVSVFVFRNEWGLESRDAYALTTSYYEKTTGEIYDVDVEINATLPEFVIEDPSLGIDLPSILTHEVGHFLGLAHSTEPGAVMRENYTPGVDNLRILTDDDISGICAVYPPARKTSTDRCAPRHGFARNCVFEPLEASGGCAQTPSPTGNASILFLGGTLAVGLVRLRRLRRSRQAPIRAPRAPGREDPRR